MSVSPAKKIKVRIMTYSFAPGLKTILHYPQEITMKHKPFTLSSKKIQVKFKYEWSPGLHTTFEHPKAIVKKNYIYEQPPKIIVKKNHQGAYMFIEIGPTILM